MQTSPGREFFNLSGTPLLFDHTYLGYAFNCSQFIQSFFGCCAFQINDGICIVPPWLLLVISAMFRPSLPRILVNWLIMFGMFLWQMAIRPTATQVPISQFGKFTEFLIFPFSRKSLTSLTAITAQFSSDSSVDAPRCGVTRIPCLPATVAFAKSVTYFFTLPLSRCFYQSILIYQKISCKVQKNDAVFHLCRKLLC